MQLERGRTPHSEHHRDREALSVISERNRRPPECRAVIYAVAALAVLVLSSLSWPVSASAATSTGALGDPSGYVQTAVIKVPVRGPLFGDIIFADNASGRVYFSDLSNSSLDVIDGRHDRLLAQIRGFTNGPGGLVADNLGQVWAGNGNGTVQVVQAGPPFRKLAAVAVGADTDEIGYDPQDHIIAVTSPRRWHRQCATAIPDPPRRASRPPGQIPCAEEGVLSRGGPGLVGAATVGSRDRPLRRGNQGHREFAQRRIGGHQSVCRHAAADNPAD